MLTYVDSVVIVRGAQFDMPREGSEKHGPIMTKDAGAEASAATMKPPGRRWFLFLAPAVGGLLTGLLIYTLAPEAEGHGTDAVIGAFHRNRGMIRGRVPFIKTIASVLTIGTGGSAGREGPIAQIGAGFGSSLAGWLKTSDRDRRLLLLAGAGAGIGAIFRAPLGGALFVAEVLYRDAEFESAALVPAFVASIVGYSVYCAITGWGPIFDLQALLATHPVEFKNPLELPFYALLGIACVLAGALYVKVFYWMRDFFKHLGIPDHVKPAIGGLAVGLMGLFIPQVLGMGYGYVQMAINSNLPLQIAIILLVAKMVATGFTIGSGGSGGVFAPSMVIGGLLGWVCGNVFHHFVPHIVTHPAMFVLVGMAAFFAGVAKAPVSSLVMVSEMTRGYGLLVPSMLTNAIAFLLTPRSISLYEKQVNARVDSGAHAGEYFFDVLERIPVSQLVKADESVVVFRRDTRLSEVLRVVSDSQHPIFPVLNNDGSLYGVIDLNDIRVMLGAPSMASGLVVAGDLCYGKFQTITPEESLAVALRKIRVTRLEALPVVKSKDSNTLVGILSRRDISNAYHDFLYRGEKV
jgi:CIC family chloride channel protein